MLIKYVINITPLYIFNSTNRGLLYHKCKKKFCYHNILVYFQIVMGGGWVGGGVVGGRQKPCQIKLLWYLVRDFIFQLASSVNFLCCQMCTFYCPLREKRCPLLPEGTDACTDVDTSGRTFIKNIKPFVIILLCLGNT